ncbi:MAG TPA: heavy metal translocating P-type ATPase [Gemmatimonadales bacterium]
MSKSSFSGSGVVASSVAPVREFRVAGMDCASCAAAIERAVRPLPGVRGVQVDVMGGTVRVGREAGYGNADLALAIRSAGYSVQEQTVDARGVDRGRLIAAGASGLLLLAGQVMGWTSVALSPIPVFLLSVVAGAWYVVPKGIRSARDVALDINVLVTIAAAGAMVLGQWAEAAAVMFLFSVAELLESFAMSRARKAIQALVKLAPREAAVRRGGTVITVPVADVQIGEVVVVRPGERVALDGVVSAGVSAVDQSPITGESIPVDKEAGSEVFAGSINGYGALDITVTSHAEDTTLARILHAVEEAQASRAPTQSLVDRFARRYTPAVVGLAALIAVVPPLVAAGEWGTWLYRALALLVIACPCALVISTPVTIVSGLTGAARAGVLIKGGSQLEAAGRVTTVAFDKTGTLTEGRPVVTDVLSVNGLGPREILRLAAAVEHHSEHPVARAIAAEARAQGIQPPASNGFTALPGRGAWAEVEGRRLFVGNLRICAELGTCRQVVHDAVADLESHGKSAMLLTDASEPLGVLAIADRPRPGARESVAALRKTGVRRVLMLTGDNAAVAASVAHQIGLDADVRSGLLPADKHAAVAQLRQDGERVAVVGDGVNDAPALAAADLGVAMGGAGTHVALETADVVLMGDDLSQVAETIRRSRRTVGIVRQNIAFALAIKAVFLVLAVLGQATLWMAVAADMGASLAVITNGLRAMHLPKSL